MDLADPWTLAALAAAMAAAGLLAGFLAGLLGIGGGLVVVPVLFEVFGRFGVPDDVRMHVAVGTSLAMIVPTSISSVRAHAERGAVDRDVLRGWAPGIAAGVLIGTVLAAFASGPALTWVFVVMALAIAANFAFGRESWRLAETLPHGPAMWSISGGIGVISAMMGIGGGMLGTTTMTLCGVPIHRAVGTSAGFGVIIAIPGAIGFLITGWDVPDRPPLSLGYINLIAAAMLIPLTVLTAPFGARVAHRLSRTTLRRAFAVFLAVVCARMVWDLYR